MRSFDTDFTEFTIERLDGLIKDNTPFNDKLNEIKEYYKKTDDKIIRFMLEVEELATYYTNECQLRAYEQGLKDGIKLKVKLD
jgi:hypothetical protein